VIGDGLRLADHGAANVRSCISTANAMVTDREPPMAAGPDWFRHQTSIGGSAPIRTYRSIGELANLSVAKQRCAEDAPSRRDGFAAIWLGHFRFAEEVNVAWNGQEKR